MSLVFEKDSDKTVSLGAANVPASTGELTITAWGFTGTLIDDEQIIFAKTAASDSGAFSLHLEDDPNNQLVGIINDDVLDAGNVTPDDEWVFWSMVYDGVDKILYVNAVEENSGADAGGDIDTGADPMNICGRDAGGDISREFDGPLADIRVYTRALSPAELLTMFTLLGADNIVHSLLWRWPMRELSPGTAATVAGSIIDLAGNLDGSPEASPLYAEGIMR